MTPDELRALPVAIDLQTAARALGIGRTKAQDLARSGQWPTPLLRLGSQYRVPTAALLRLLEIAPDSSEAAAVTAAPATRDSSAPQPGGLRAV